MRFEVNITNSTDLKTCTSSILTRALINTRLLFFQGRHPGDPMGRERTRPRDLPVQGEKSQLSYPYDLITVRLSYCNSGDKLTIMA